MAIEMMQISLQSWSLAVLIGFFFLAFRKDSYTVIRDIERMLMRYPAFSILTIIFLFVIVPFTIPFSLHNIFFTRNDNTPNNRKPDE